MDAAGSGYPAIAAGGGVSEVLAQCLHLCLRVSQELLWAEEVCKRDPMVKKACDAIGIKQEDIAVDGEDLEPELPRGTTFR